MQSELNHVCYFLFTYSELKTNLSYDEMYNRLIIKTKPLLNEPLQFPLHESCLFKFIVANATAYGKLFIHRVRELGAINIQHLPG